MCQRVVNKTRLWAFAALAFFDSFLLFLLPALHFLIFKPFEIRSTPNLFSSLFSCGPQIPGWRQWNWKRLCTTVPTSFWTASWATEAATASTGPTAPKVAPATLELADARYTQPTRYFSIHFFFYFFFLLGDKHGVFGGAHVYRIVSSVENVNSPVLGKS